MDPARGFISLARSFDESDIFQNEKWLKVFLWCLIQANHKSKNVPVQTGRSKTVVKVERGQFIFGRNKAAEKLNMSPSTVRNIMDRLELLGSISIKKDNHYSVVTLCNYNEYQDVEFYKGQATDNQWTGNGQPMDTTNKPNKPNNDNNKKPPVEKAPTKKTYSEEFENWWKIFKGNPTHGKGDKSKAFTEYKKIKPDQLPDLMKGTENYSNSTDGSYKAMNFLKQEIWKLHLVLRVEQNNDQEQEQNPNAWHEPQTAKQA